MNVSVLNKLKSQLLEKEAFYETRLIWEERNYMLENNTAGSLGRLIRLLKNLKQEPDKFKEYDDVIKSQLQEGIVQIAPEITDKSKEFYLPHKPVYREDAEATKVRVVYDASAKATRDSLSLNDCLETGPKLQNLLWDILVRKRFKPICLCVDIKKAFFQIRIRESERDAPRFLWLRDIRNERIEILRFTQLDYKKYVRWRINFVWFQTRSFRTQGNCYSDIPSRRIQATQIPFQL